MNTQSNQTGRLLRSGEALHLGRLGGDLTAVDGRIWLTRDGDLGDHFLEPGERIRLEVDENAVIEAARPGEQVSVRWNPRRQSLLGALAEEPLRGLAFLAGRAAAGLQRLAGVTTAGLHRAEGHIGAAE